MLGTQTLQGPASGRCLRSAGNPAYRRLPLTPQDSQTPEPASAGLRSELKGLACAKRGLHNPVTPPPRCVPFSSHHCNSPPAFGRG